MFIILLVGIAFVVSLLVVIDLIGVFSLYKFVDSFVQNENNSLFLLLSISIGIIFVGLILKARASRTGMYTALGIGVVLFLYSVIGSFWL